MSEALVKAEHNLGEPATAAPLEDITLAGTGRGFRGDVLTRPLSRLLFQTAFPGILIVAVMAVVASAGAQWNLVILLSGAACVALLLVIVLAPGEGGEHFLSDDGRCGGRVGTVAAALAAHPDPALVTDARGRVIWASLAYKALAGTVTKSGDSEIAPPPERIFLGASAIYRLTQAACRGVAAREIVGRIPLRAGEGDVFTANVSPIDKKGAALWTFSVLRRAPVVRTKTLEWADDAPVGLFLADARGRVLDANSTLRNWLGVRPDAVFELRDFTTNDTADAFADSRGADGPVCLRAHLKLADGEQSPAMIRVDWSDDRSSRARVAVYDLSTGGAPPALAGIEPVKTCTSGDNRASGVFDDIFITAPFGVARLDNADPALAMVASVNPTLMQLSGGRAKPGVKFADLISLDDDGAIENVLCAAPAGRGEPSEARLKSSEDEGRAVQVFLSPVRDGKRVAYLVDISSWKALEQQVAQAGKMQAVGQLASGVAHDFNNMLTAIQLGVDELLNRHPVGDPSYQDLQQINSTLTRQAGLVRKLLAFSRKQTFRNAVLDLSDVLSDCSIMLGQILEETVRLEIKHDRELPLVRADRNQIENILVNLATNARDAMKPSGGGVLTISTEALTAEDVAHAGAPNPGRGDWAAIHVADTGVGMDETMLEKIFEPFFTTKEAGQGTGLGLATVYGVVKQSGGFLFVDSEVGKGAAFHIYLPGHVPTREEEAELALEKEIRAKALEPSDLAGCGRILFVEDENAVRAIAARTLARRGYEVVEACDGEEALEILEKEPESFDLLVSDVVMPGLDGPSLLQRGRHLLGKARIIFMSGYAREEFSDTLSKDLRISFLPKPFDVQQLAERVKDELAAR